MAQRTVSMHAAYKSREEIIDGFLARPLTTRPSPALVLLHGYRGVDDTQRAVTRRFAREGFVCLSPDLFSGKISRDRALSAYLKTSLDIDRAVEKIIDSVAYLRLLPFVARKKIALSGFCMGGGLALLGMFKDALTKYGKKFEIHMYEGAEHAFLNSPGVRGGPNRTAAERSFNRSCKWLKKMLV
jgi:dienelactone hydrolase